MTVNHDVTGSSPVGGAMKSATIKLVSMTLRVHLFPSRTQKLSSVVPKIVPWRRGVKIGRCQYFVVGFLYYFADFGSAFLLFFAYNLLRPQDGYYMKVLVLSLVRDPKLLKYKK